MGGAGPPSCKTGRLFLVLLALTMPIINNFQFYGATGKNLKIWMFQFLLFAQIIPNYLIIYRRLCINHIWDEKKSKRISFLRCCSNGLESLGHTLYHLSFPYYNCNGSISGSILLYLFVVSLQEVLVCNYRGCSSNSVKFGVISTIPYWVLTVI